MRTIIKSKSIITISFICFCIQLLSAQEYPVERMYLHLNKNIFVAGECCWFKAYNINVNTKTSSNVSDIAYIELLNDQGISIIQKSIPLNEGMGDCGFTISKKLPTGYYYISSFTNWNKSISPELTSLNEIYIYNNDLPQDDNSEKNSLSIEKNFELKTLSNATNSILLKENQFEIEAKLTDLEQILRIKIQTNNTNNQKLKFVISSKKGVQYNRLFNTTDSISIFEVPIKEFKDNNHLLAIKNTNDQTLCDYCLHTDFSTFAGSISKKETLLLKKRESKKLTFHLSSFRSLSDTLKLSASIKLKEPVNIVRKSDINNFLKVLIDFPAHTFNELLQNRQSLNSNWISSSNLEQIETIEHSFSEVTSLKYPEKEAYVLEGRLLDQNENPVQNQRVFFSKVGSFAEINPEITNDDGKFFFKLPISKGLHDIAFQTRELDSLKIKYRLKDKFLEKAVGIKRMPNPILSEQEKIYFKNNWENYKIRELYNHKDFSELVDSTIYRSKNNFFGQPTQTYSIKDFIALDSLPEYFHELIPTVKVRYRNKGYSFNIFNPEIETVFSNPALTLYDGIIIDDIDEIMHLDPQSIDRIEVVSSEYYYKSEHFYGVVHIISKSKKCELQELPMNTERYYHPLFMSEIIKDEYKKPEKNHPDFRTDLLWQPNIEITKDKKLEINFTTSDLKGKYELVIEGISNLGEPILLKQDIIVD